MRTRSCLVLSTGLLSLAVACGGKTAGIGSGGPGSSSSGSGGGGSGGSGSGSGGGTSSSGGSGISPPPGCTADSSVTCGQGSRGYICAGGISPSGANQDLACSTPVPSGERETYCCSMAPSTGCWEDPDWTRLCPGPMAIGYMCTLGDDPVSYDPTLTCAAPKSDAAMMLYYYCCND